LTPLIPSPPKTNICQAIRWETRSPVNAGTQRHKCINTARADQVELSLVAARALPFHCPKKPLHCRAGFIRSVHQPVFVTVTNA